MSTNKQYRTYFATQMRGGKSRLATAIDFLLVRLFILFCAYIWFLWQINNAVLSAFLSVLTTIFFTVALFIYDSIKLDRYIQKSIQQLHKKALLEHLMLLDNNQMRDLLQTGLELVSPSRCFDVIVSQNTLYAVLQLHPTEKVTPSMLLKYYQGAIKCKCDTVKLFATAPFGAAAVEIAGRMDVNMILLDSDQLIALAQQQNLLPSEVALDAIIGAQILRKQALIKRYKNAFDGQNAKRYLYASAVILLASAVTGYQVYYAICASICLVFAAICYYNGKRKRPVAYAT